MPPDLIDLVCSPHSTRATYVYMRMHAEESIDKNILHMTYKNNDEYKTKNNHFVCNPATKCFTVGDAFDKEKYKLP